MAIVLVFAIIVLLLIVSTLRQERLTFLRSARHRAAEIRSELENKAKTVTAPPTPLNTLIPTESPRASVRQPELPGIMGRTSLKIATDEFTGISLVKPGKSAVLSQAEMLRRNGYTHVGIVYSTHPQSSTVYNLYHDGSTYMILDSNRQMITLPRVNRLRDGDIISGVSALRGEFAVSIY